jgi:hypothetical protein
VEHIATLPYRSVVQDSVQPPEVQRPVESDEHDPCPVPDIDDCFEAPDAQLWQFGRGKPRLGGLTVKETAERKKAAREEKFKRASSWETRRRRKSDKA